MADDLWCVATSCVCVSSCAVWGKLMDDVA